MSVQASWRGVATTRQEVERIFGAPTRQAPNGTCTDLGYVTTGCACTFTVCSEQTVVSKSFTFGAAAVPALITSDPATLMSALVSLQESLRQTQAQVSNLQQKIDGLAPPVETLASPVVDPARSVVAAPKPVRKRCKAQTSKGVRCTRQAAAGSDYCWQHR